MIIYLKNKQTLQIDDFNFKCCIGKKGVTLKKKKVIKKHPKEYLKLKIYIIEKIELKNPKLFKMC